MSATARAPFSTPRKRAARQPTERSHCLARQANAWRGGACKSGRRCTSRSAPHAAHLVGVFSALASKTPERVARVGWQRQTHQHLHMVRQKEMASRDRAIYMRAGAQLPAQQVLMCTAIAGRRAPACLMWARFFARLRPALSHPASALTRSRAQPGKAEQLLALSLRLQVNDAGHDGRLVAAMQ